MNDQTHDDIDFDDGEEFSWVETHGGLLSAIFVVAMWLLAGAFLFWLGHKFFG